MVKFIVKADLRPFFLNRYLSFLLIGFLVSGNSYAQKLEREYRINENTVPLKAQTFIDRLKFDKQIKWYAEEGLMSKSIEAKTKYHKKRYSVEFDTTGNIQDIEIQISSKEIPARTLQAIKDNLEEEFLKFKFIKIQLQYSGDREVLIKMHSEEWDETAIIRKYEIVLKGKDEQKTQWFEYTFSEQGAIEKRAVIIFRNTDNLEY